MLTDHPRGHDLPGLLAPIVPLSTDDGRGGRHALLWDRRTGRSLSAVLRCSPGRRGSGRPAARSTPGSPAFGGFLADLGYQPMVRHVAITVDTAPSGGTTLRDYVAAGSTRPPPPRPGRVMDELVDATPATAPRSTPGCPSPSTRARANPRPTDLLAAVVDVDRWLPGLETASPVAGSPCWAGQRPSG